MRVIIVTHGARRGRESPAREVVRGGTRIVQGVSGVKFRSQWPVVRVWIRIWGLVRVAHLLFVLRVWQKQVLPHRFKGRWIVVLLRAAGDFGGLC